MLQEVPSEARGALRPLFDSPPGLHGIVEAVLSGAMGSAYADDPASPRLAVLNIDFQIVGGRADDAGLRELVEYLPNPSWLAVPPDWHELLLRRCPANLTPYQRFDFDAGAWDRSALQGFIDALPAGFNLRRVTAKNVRAFAGLDSALAGNFASLEDFVERGLGFGVEHQGLFVSGCSSFALGGGKLEIEIDTHADFRRRGFATAAAAALLLHCQDAGIEPCWDAGNEASARLATKLGFVNRRPYTCYSVECPPVFC